MLRLRDDAAQAVKAKAAIPMPPPPHCPQGQPGERT
jgi:hypothetical protein